MKTLIDFFVDPFQEDDDQGESIQGPKKSKVNER